MDDAEALARIPRPCTATGCWRLVRSDDGRCEEHPRAPLPDARRRADRKRGSAAARGYDARWHRLRNRLLVEEPLCRHCRNVGIVEPAVEVDHIVPLKAGGARLDPANCQPLCRPCHRRKTARDRRSG